LPYLVDTHALLWWMSDDPRLSSPAREVFRSHDTEMYWSVASSFEMAVKMSIGKLTLGRPLDQFLQAVIQEQGLGLLPITNAHCAHLAQLPTRHRDPFDRVLISQAQTDGLCLLTADKKIHAYNVDYCW